MGHEVIIANPRQLKLISGSIRKGDRLDAQTLARLTRIDPQLLRPIRHRSDKAQAALMIIRVRAALIEARTSLVNTARGLAKALGERLPICDADQMGVERAESLPKQLQHALEPLLREVEALTEKIKDSDHRVEQIARTDYPETKLLQQVSGVGPLIALTFVLTVEDKNRFQKSRDIGYYVGLRPRRSDSGESQPQLRIHERRRLVLAKDAGARSALHFESSRSVHRSETMGAALGRTWREASEEKSSHSSSAEIGYPASPIMGNR